MSWMIKNAFNCCAGNDNSKKEKVFNTMNWTVNEANHSTTHNTFITNTVLYS